MKQTIELKPVYMGLNDLIEGRIIKVFPRAYYNIIHKECVFESCGTVLIKYAVSKMGDYIGTSKVAFRLVNIFGITHFEKREPSVSVCSIGFNPKRKRWYGWSHRAIASFGIRSRVKKGDCGYEPRKGEWVAKSLSDAKQMAKDFAEDVS